MEIDVENRSHVALLVVVVLLAMVITSVGFWLVSENPLVPDARFDAYDADQRYNLSNPGTVNYLVIEHHSGESIEFENLEIIVGGTRAGGAVLTPENGFTDRSGQFMYQARTAEGEIDPSGTFAPGDRLIISKVEGTGDIQGPFEVRVRLYHRPSQRTVLDRNVPIR